MKNARIPAAQERLNDIWHDYLMHGGPRKPVTDAIEREAARLYADLTDPIARTNTFAMFRERGIDVAAGPPALPAVTFALDCWLDRDWPGPEAAPQPFKGYHGGRTWNGWQEPLVTREVLETLIPLVSDGSFMRWSMRADGALIVTYLESDMAEDGPQEILPVATATVDGEIPLYSIGLGLVWVLA